MTIRVYHPKLIVRLYKAVGRASASGAAAVSTRYASNALGSVVDLSAYLVDGSQVQVSKNVRQPAGGFSLTFGDRAKVDAPGDDGSASFESLYGLFEPMDLVEIRMAHDPTQYGGEPPIVMRGFVTGISRNEAVGGDGRPQRTVLVQGQDYGKIWQLIQLQYFQNYIVGEQYLSSFRLYEKYGIGFETVQRAQDFIVDAVKALMDDYLARFMPETVSEASFPRSINTSLVESVGGATVSPALQSFEGTLHQLLAQFGDVGAWNELFLDDREDGVYCVYRPNPFRSADTGEYLLPVENQPDTIDVSADDVISLSVSRSDADVANFYFVDNPEFVLNRSGLTQLYAQNGYSAPAAIGTYPNASVSLYGVRIMQARSRQGGDTATTFASGPKADVVAQEQNIGRLWIDQRRSDLIALNRDNIVFESGSITMRGNEAIRAGSYIRLTRGSFVSEYYVVGVSHSFAPFGRFTTTLQVERGTGFIRRIQQGGGLASPYLQELSAL